MDEYQIHLTNTVKDITGQIKNENRQGILVCSKRLRDKVGELIEQYGLPLSTTTVNEKTTLLETESSDVKEEWKKMVNDALSEKNVDHLLVNTTCHFIYQIIKHADTITSCLVFEIFPHNTTQYPQWIHFIIIMAMVLGNVDLEIFMRKMCDNHGIDHNIMNLFE